MSTQTNNTNTLNITQTSNKANILYETDDLVLANRLRSTVLRDYSQIYPWVFLYKKLNGITQNFYYEIEVANQFAHKLPDETIKDIELTILTTVLSYEDEKRS